MSKNQPQAASPAADPNPAAGGDQNPAPAPAPQAASVPAKEAATDSGFVCLESFTHNDLVFQKGEAITAAKLSKIDGPTKQRRMQNGFIGFSA